MDSNQPARTRQMAITRKTGPRSGIGKATSESERKDPIRAQTRGSDPSAVSLGLNRSNVRLNNRTTKTRAAICAASSIWLSMPWPGSKDISRDLTAIALNVAKTPNVASRDALPKISPLQAIRKTSVPLVWFFGHHPTVGDGEAEKCRRAPCAARFRGALAAV